MTPEQIKASSEKMIKNALSLKMSDTDVKTFWEMIETYAEIVANMPKTITPHEAHALHFEKGAIS
jgi:hypothetical protein